MDLRAKDARDALKAVDRTRGRAGAFSAYARMGPAVAAWGAVWLVANLVSYYWPSITSAAWGVGILAGTGASIASGLSARKAEPDPRRRGRLLRYGFTALVIAFFNASVFTVLGVTDRIDVNAAICLAVAAGYALIGVWTGSRFLWIGLGIAAATLSGWGYAREYFELWMGLVCGGALIATGLWLRRA